MSQQQTPRLMDATLARFAIPLQRTDDPAPLDDSGALYATRGDDRAEGDFGGQAMRFSPYTWMATHPKTRAAASGGVLAGAAMLFARGRNGAR